MISLKQQLSIVSQCQLLAVPRDSLYYRPRPVPASDQQLQQRLMQEHLRHPYAGARRLCEMLRRVGVERLGLKRVRRLMRASGITALYPRRRTSQPCRAHRRYPYLLRDLVINRPNQIWCADLTYVPMRCGTMYLVAVMDWYSRRVLSWRLSQRVSFIETDSTFFWR